MTRLLLPLLLLSMWLSGADGVLWRAASESPASIPDVEVIKTDTRLQRAGGLLYYAGIPFSGHLLARYENDAIKSTTPYDQGKAYGLAQGWYPDGAKKFVRWYQRGKKEGTHVGWWDNGATQFVYHFQNGLHEGNAKEWYPNGLRYRDFNYASGKESGAQQMWYQDGTLRANYVVKDGRRYGLIGSKPCASKT